MLTLEHIKRGWKYHGAKGSDTSVLFIHGLNRGPDDWIDKDFLPALLESGLSDCDFLSFGYCSHWLFDRASFTELARTLEDWLKMYCSTYKAIITVAHSAGCILLRETVVQLSQSNSTLLDKFKHSYLLDPPMDGSAFSELKKLFPILILITPLVSPKIRSLQLQTTYLTTLKKRLDRLADSRPYLRFTPVYADYGGAGILWKILNLTKLDHLSTLGSVHSVVSFHGEMPAPSSTIHRQQTSLAANTTLIQSIVRTVKDVREKVDPPRCLFCDLDKVHEKSYSSDLSKESLEDLLKSVDNLLVEYPDNEDLLTIRMSTEYKLRVISSEADV